MTRAWASYKKCGTGAAQWHLAQKQQVMYFMLKGGQAGEHYGPLALILGIVFIYLFIIKNVILEKFACCVIKSGTKALFFSRSYGLICFQINATQKCGP